MQKNLNDIIPPSRRRAMGSEEQIPNYTTSGGMTPDAPERPSYARPSRTSRKFPLGTAIGALVVVGLSIGALFAFAKSEVSIVPTQNVTSVAGDFIASAGEGDLPFEVITVERVASVSVASEGTENVNQSAQGTITIENKQDVPQQLIKNTRFESPDGQIFRIRDSITVPAQKGTTPGTVQATVFADAAGQSYNIGATTFTLPGLKGGATFDLVRAKSTEAMKGGFSGPRPTVAKATRDAKTAELNTKLAQDMDAALSDAIPEGYILLKGASRISNEAQPDAAGTGNNVELSQKAVATAVIFPEAALAKAIAYQVLGSYNGQPVSLAESESLTLSPVGDIPAPGASEFAFSLSGSTNILWSVDPAKIASSVAGKARASAEATLAGFPEIKEAKLVTRPFWNRSYPQDPAKIEVTVENPSESK